MSKEAKVDIVEFVDGDYGDCLRVEINGQPQTTFVLKNKDAKMHVLRATIAELFFKNEELRKQTEEAQEFKATFQKLLKLSGIISLINRSTREWRA